MERRSLATLLWFALFCWAGGVVWLSSLRPDELPEAAFMFWDKFNHFASFTVGGWLAAQALLVSRPRIRRAGPIIGAILLIAAFGAFDEALQNLTPGRTGADVYDWTADLVGAATGALLSLGAPLARLVR